MKQWDAILQSSQADSLTPSPLSNERGHLNKDRNMSRPRHLRLAFGHALALVCHMTHAQVAEADAKPLAMEWKALVTEGTGVINDLQPQINAGTLPPNAAQVESLVAQFKARYKKNTGAELELQGNSQVVSLRNAYIKAFMNVAQKKSAVMAKGGQDSLVPAHFRALVVGELNKSFKGSIQGYTTNRDAELINGDWAVKVVMKQSPMRAEVQQLVDQGKMEPVFKKEGNTFMGYWPMTLQASCVACHAQNGLQQQVGKFGGALVAEVSVK
jgi:hypothetical protein